IRVGESSGTRLRHGLVITQFALAAALIAGTLVMRQQVRYMQSAELKFDSEQIVVVEVGQEDFEDSEMAAARLETFRTELRRSSAVSAVSTSSHTPGRWAGWFTFAQPEGWGDADPLRVRLAFVDDAYFETYGVELLGGRNFDRAMATDEQAVIVNRAALRAFGCANFEVITDRHVG